MVTDDLVAALEALINRFDTDEKKDAGNSVLYALMNFDEDEWYGMNNEEKDCWINQYL